jgi:hypothetical protein
MRAMALPKTAIIPFRADAELAYHNVVDGVNAVLAERVTLSRELPGADLAAIEALPALAQAVVFAAGQVDRRRLSNGEIARLLKEAYPLRDLLLTTAEALAKKKLLPDKTVSQIRAGRGRLDAAKDLVALAALYRKHASALRNKTAVTADEVARAAEIGSELLTLLKPKRAKRTGPSPGHDAAEMRDRLWTLLVLGKEARGGLDSIAGWLWGQEAWAHVPPLQAHRATKARVAKPAKPAAKPTSASTATG